MRDTENLLCHSSPKRKKNLKLSAGREIDMRQSKYSQMLIAESK